MLVLRYLANRDELGLSRAVYKGIGMSFVESR